MSPRVNVWDSLFGKHHPFPCVPNKLSKLVRIRKFRVLNLGIGSMSTHQTGGFIMDLFFSLYAYFWCFVNMAIIVES